MRDLINAIAKTADPITLAGLLNSLMGAEADPQVTDAEAEAAETAFNTLYAVLDNNVGEAEAARLIHGYERA